jgi:hypothetical protein
MPAPGVTVRRALVAGARDETVRLPAGWEPVPLRSLPPAPPPAARDLPRPRSLRLPGGPGGPLLVVVNDAQRATPTPWLLGLLDCDWDAPGVRVAVATGCHAPPDERELREIFGGLLERVRPRLHVHRAAADPMVRLGATSRGTPVEVAALLDGPAAVVCVGSVEPHYFAGWTGGRKSLVPGLASLETMRANHRLAIEPGAAIGALAGNPLHEDLVEATRLVCERLRSRGAPEPLGLNALVARGAVHAWHFGPLLDATDALAGAGWRLFGRTFGAPAPLVLCFVDHPLDRDLYQALKGLEHWKSAVAPGGTLAIVADCPEGVGPPTFTQFAESGTTLAAIERRAREDYRLGDHKLLNFLRFAASGRRVCLVSPALAGRAGLPLPVHASIAEAVAHIPLPAGPGPRRAILVEDAATLAPSPPPGRDGEVCS